MDIASNNLALDKVFATLDLEKLTALIWAFVGDIGKVRRLEVCDVTFYGDKDNLMASLEDGNKFFDAAFYFSIDEEARPTPQDAKAGDMAHFAFKKTQGEEQHKRNAELCLKYLALYMLIRGVYPTDKDDCPPFITRTLRCDVKPIDVCKSLFSHDMTLVDPSWIKGFHFENVSVELKNRLTLGMPGHRYLTAISIYPPKADLTAEVKERLEWVRGLHKVGPSWFFFPITRSHLIIDQFGNFNSWLDHLILSAFDHTVINTMLANKSIRSYPKARTDVRSPVKLPDWLAVVGEQSIFKGKALADSQVLPAVGPSAVEDLKVTHLKGPSTSAPGVHRPSKEELEVRYAGFTMRDLKAKINEIENMRKSAVDKAEIKELSLEIAYAQKELARQRELVPDDSDSE